MGLVAPRSEANKDARDIVSHDFSRVQQGRVITVGDIHGATAFSALMKSLNPNDKVVLVGDLMDRGADTYKNLQTIITDQRFLAVRGNHEELFVNYMRARRNLMLMPKDSRRVDNLNEPDRTARELFLQNGGDWAKKLTLEQLEPIEQYINALPYILEIKLRNDQKFLVCHADMSFLSDAVLQNRLEGKDPLTDEEKTIVTWARRSGGEILYEHYTHQRTAQSTTVYCGHEITTKEGVSVVRTDTNHVNLDFGAYAGVPLVGVEHPNKAIVFGTFDRTIQSDERLDFFDQLFCLHQRMKTIEFSNENTREAYYAHLRSKNFSFAERDCTRMDFSGANLTGANLTRANLTGANLTGANLTGANLTGVILDQDSKITIDQLREATWEYIQYADGADVVWIPRSSFDSYTDTNFADLANQIKTQDAFQTNFKAPLKKSAIYQAADKNQKIGLLLTANQIIGRYHNQPAANNTVSIIETATQRVLALQTFKNNNAFLTVCATNSNQAFEAAYASKIREKDTNFAKEIDSDMQIWKVSTEEIPSELINRFLVTSFQIAENAKVKNPTSSQQLTFLIDRLDKKLAEYNIRADQKYKTGANRDGETYQKMNEAEWMKQYLCAMRGACFVPPSQKTLPDFISETVDKKWDYKQCGNVVPGTGIPPRPQHTFGSELIAIHNDLNQFEHDKTQEPLKQAHKDENEKQKEFKNKEKEARTPFGTIFPAGHQTRVPVAIAKLALTLATLKQREIEYARRVAFGDLHSGIFSTGISAKDKLAATRDLIQAVEAYFKPDQEKKIAIVFSSEAAKKAAEQGSLREQYSAIIKAARDAGVRISSKVSDAASATPSVPSQTRPH